MSISNKKIAIVTSYFNTMITSELQKGAKAHLLKKGISNVSEFTVPGAFELPLTCKLLAKSGKYSAIIALGAVIRGETPHFDYVCNETARGINQVSLETEIPCIFGVLTVDNVEQAMDRIGGQHGHKGVECAQAAIEMIELLSSIK